MNSTSSLSVPQASFSAYSEYPEVIMLVPPTNKNLRLGESLGMGYLVSGLIRKGISVTALDCTARQISSNQAINLISLYPPQLLCLSLQHRHSIAEARAIASQVKRLDNPPTIVIGGVFASFEASRLIENEEWIDYVFTGEADIDFPEWAMQFLKIRESLHATTHSKHIPKSSRLLRNNAPKKLDFLPFPARSEASLVEGGGHVEMLLSRGCPQNCSFCSVASITKAQGGCRRRSLQNVTLEVDFLIRKYNLEAISFIDDWMSLNSLSTQNLGQTLAERNIRWGCSSTVTEILLADLDKLTSLGLRYVFVGIESFIPRQLQLYGKPHSPDEGVAAIKKMQEHNLDFQIGFIPLDPAVTPSEIKRNVKTLKETGVCGWNSLINRLAVYRGSALFEEMSSSCTLIEKEEYRYIWNFIDPMSARVFRTLLKGFSDLSEIENSLARQRFLASKSETAPQEVAEKLLSNMVADNSLAAIDRLISGENAATVADDLKRAILELKEQSPPLS